MFRRVFLIFAVLIFTAVFSYSISGDPIPPELANWQDWVKYEQEYRACPSLNGSQRGVKNNHLCAWPGKLVIDVNDTRASFAQQWKVIDKSLVPLPGNRYYWPKTVMVNQKKMVVLENKNRPYILLSKGEYSIKGIISWSKRPESLPIPAQVALLEVSVNGKLQPFVSLEKNHVWLGSIKKLEIKEKDFLKLWGNRLIIDGHPMKMVVALEMEVSGRAREQKLTNFASGKYQLMAISSVLNTRIDSQGDLLVQLKPGNHRIKLTFKINGFPEKLTFDQTGDDWPIQEIWVYQDNQRLRSTQIQGISSIDPEQGFVDEWKSLPHYVINHKQDMLIKERRRGISHNLDSLFLERQMWLSFDNKYFYFFDHITGQKSKDWRVSMLDNYHLTQLSNHGKERLVTFDEKLRTGAEIRTPTIDIRAGGEVKRSDMQYASGWDIAFANTSIRLNIPPGRKLLNISGADTSYGDWSGRWKLIDLFFILVIIALVFKSFGLLASSVALVTLVLGYHETNMPVFWWFNLVVALSLAAKVTSARLITAVNVYKWLSLGILMLTLLPFLAGQIRMTLYPQLEISKPLVSGPGYYPTVSQAKEKAEQLLLEDKGSLMRTREPRVQERIEINGSRISPPDLDASYEPGAVIQAGKGKPDWLWYKAGYAWNGPVEGSEQVSISILSEFWVKVWRIALILFSVLWLWSILTRYQGFKEQLQRFVQERLTGDAKNGVNSVITGIVIIFLLSLNPINNSVSASEYPGEELLKELQERLYPKHLCEPDCVSVSHANLKVRGSLVELEMEFQGNGNKAGLIPGSSDWRINRITLNKKPLKNLWRNSKGNWIALPEGITKVIISANLKDKSDLSIIFPEKPKHFEYQIEGWEISGVNLGRLMGNSIQLTRLNHKLMPGGSGEVTEISKTQEQSIADLFFLTRSFNFGNQWKLTTEVYRKAPQVGTLTTIIPLLAYEKPLQMTDNVKGDNMQVVIPGNQQSISWNSSISGTQSFELIALDDNSVNESWEILVYPNWNIQIEGLPAVMPDDLEKDDYWVYQYFPRAGETLSFSINKPTAVEGSSVAITSVEQRYQISKRKTTNELSFNYRATRAEQLLLHIGDAEVKQLSHDGIQLNLGDVDGVVSIGLKPGKHSVQLELEAPLSIDVQFDLLSPDLNLAFTNLSTRVNLPDSRWLIAASGPGYGPAVIYWGEIIFFALLAIGLARLPFSPLNYWRWLVLGLGMSTFSWPALAFVSAWLLASEWRRKNKTENQKYRHVINWVTLFSTIAAVLALVVAVPFGLLQTPDMGVVGNGSFNNSLFWFLDRGEGALRKVTIYSLPIWVYKGLMLVWATWLSFSLIKWVGWIWHDLSGAKFTKGRVIIKPESGHK